MQKNKKNSIIIPVRNEPSLQELVTNIEKILTPFNYEILIISGDKNKIPLTIISSSNLFHFKCYGDSLERAILLGFSVATGQNLIVMDGDGSHPYTLLPTFINHLDIYEMVIASRFLQEGKYSTSFFRSFTSQFFTKFAQLFGSPLTDPMSGFFGIQSQLLQKMKFKPYTWKTALEIHSFLNPSTKEVPISFTDRKHGKSKTNARTGLRILYNIMESAI